jgi:hypothetical protein
VTHPALKILLTVALILIVAGNLIAAKSVNDTSIVFNKCEQDIITLTANTDYTTNDDQDEDEWEA